jgi:hypothetical protein
VEIAALGRSPQLDCILRRLTSRGIVLAPEPPPSPFLVSDWLGLAAPGLLVDLSGADVATLRQRAGYCQSAPAAYVELAAPWLPLGEQLGFMLFVGATPEAIAAAKPILDALAPLPGAWLHCGPAGAAAFVFGLYRKIWQACLACFPSHQGEAQQTRPDWMALLQRHQQLAQELYDSARAYLDGLPESEQPELEAGLLNEFALPPMLQVHYARTLAAVIVLALGHHPLTAQVLDQFWRNHNPA